MVATIQPEVTALIRAPAHPLTGAPGDEAPLLDQFDAVLHVDRTRAAEPLERTPRWEGGEAPETYPSAL